MNPTTSVTVDGAKVELELGRTYRVRFRRDRILDGVELVRRERNGDLVFGQPSEDGETFAVTYRIRTRDLVAIFPSVAPSPAEAAAIEEELAKRSVIVPRKDGETARDYLRRLERGLGKGSYLRWIETDAGQAALAAAAAEDQAGRRAAAKLAKVAPVETFPPIDQAIAGAVGVPVSVEITPRGRKLIEQQAAEAIVGRSRAKEPLTPEEEARRAANRAREMSRNVQWTCPTCHRRTRRPACADGHPLVSAPVGKRRDAR